MGQRTSVLEPLEFFAKLAGLIPPPAINLG
jgi:hypothetical protein